MENLFIKAISVDENRITVAVQEAYHHFLKEDMIKKMLRDTATTSLGDHFLKLEVSPSTFRITVEEASINESVKIIKEEIGKNIEMALSFLNAMNQ